MEICLKFHFLELMVSIVSHLALISLIVYNTNVGLATDTMLPLQSVTVGETLTSPGQVFELGFFSPPNSTRRYIGIWYKNIPETLVWVGNRENPLSSSDQSARLMLSKDGNLELLDGNQSLVWSSNISVHLNKSAAVISDTGNFVLKESDSGWIAWQSFDYLCGVFLATMQKQVNTKTGEKLIMDSWRSEDDPAPGNFTAGLLSEIPVQSFVWNGSEKYWRSGPWNGLKFVGIPDDDVDYINAWSIHQNSQSGILYFATNQYDNSTVTILKLFPDGSLRTMVWNETHWSADWEAPGSPCDVYGTCGGFAACNPNKSPMCSCLRGFVPSLPEEWSKGNWTDGCIRRTDLACSRNTSENMTSVKSDGFLKLSSVKVPDLYQYLPLENSEEECHVMCLTNCSCTAYAYVTGIGCLIWARDLIDLQEFAFAGEDLFIRLAHSELVGNKKRVLLISLTISLATVTLSLFAYGIYRSRCKRQEGKNFIQKDKDLSLRDSQVDTNELPTFEFEELLAATNGFSKENKIGEGGFGTVFRGKLEEGREVAIKRLSSHSCQGISEFRNEILVISKLQHRNLVKILGCCIKGDEQLIVYEYLPNRSLDTYLFDKKKKEQLNWALRVNIIQCIARGLSYLHRDSRLRVIHRDLKASNILLDNDMNPKISDFGLARTFQPKQDSDTTLRVVGTFGYMSPEYAMTGLFSEKSDVFSFGVLVLEIISGRKNNSFLCRDEDLSLIAYVWRLWSNDRALEMVDESLDSPHSGEVVRCIHVGLLCVQDHPDDRPTMSTVILMLSSETPLPEPKQPSFFLPSHSTFDHRSVCSINVVTTSHVEGR